MWAVAIVPVSLQDKFKAEAKAHCTRIYIPMIRYSVKVKHKNKPIEKVKPAFGSYIFVRIRDGRLRKVLDLKSCRGFVMSQDEVAHLPSKAVKRIKELEAANFVSSYPRPAVPVSVGDRVRVNSTGFEEAVGEVLTLLKKGHVEIGLGNMRFIVAVDKIRHA